MSRRPNYLFFITDQQRSDWLGCYDHPVLRTPNIDRIAAEGTRFDDFHVASPVCMPNRASLLTGRMPSVHGLRYNGCSLPWNTHTFLDVLRAAGYETASIGKSHLQPFTPHGAVGLDDGRERLIEEARRPDRADYMQEQPDRYAAAERYRLELPYYGFEHVDMVTAHGDRCGGHYVQWFRDNCPDWEALHDDANELPHNYSCPQAYRTPVPEELYPTAYVADRAIDYLEARGSDDAPFFLFVSFPDPHHPFTPPGRYWDLYSPEQFTVRLPYEAHSNPTPPMQWISDNWKRGEGQRTRQTAMRVDEQHIREAMALTAGMIAMIDDQVGRIMAALDDKGLHDDTVVCFTSDHGDYMGDYGLLLKGALPFRSITQVPMIWSDPEDRTAGSTRTLASTLDLPATILDRCGLTPYRGMQGRSLMPTIREGADHRDELLIEYNDSLARLGFPTPARVRVLRTPEWRFTLYLDEEWGELYDVANDPDESRNLWDDPQHAAAKAALSLRLNHQMTALMDESPVAERMA